MLHASRRTHTVAATTLAATVVAAGLAYAGSSLAASGPADVTVNGAARRNTTTDRSAEVASAIDSRKAKNVILLIGDGMGDSEITSARNYAKGAAGRFDGIDALPLTGQYTTYSVNRTTGLPDYVPDSSATGSAWATGTKTYDNAVSVDYKGKPQQTILELAKAAGLKTGDVTTSEIQDATPAVQVSHISQRACYGPAQTDITKPAATNNCPEASLSATPAGLGSITEQLLNTRRDVTLGVGLATFGQSATGGTYAGKTLEAQARERGYQVLGTAATGTTAAVPGTKAQLDAITSADQTKPLLGLFGTGNLPVRYTGPAAVVDGDKATPSTCTPNPAQLPTQPKLADMTSKAISLLDNPKGFFLQVEGASIDKQDHSADACGQIGEVVDLDEAVQAALAFAKKDGNTSVFVTADHAHTSQIIEVGSTSPGLSVALTTADGAPMAINYGTSPLGGSQQHTGGQLRIAGYGPQAANVVGLTDQTDLFFTMRNALFGIGSTLPTTPTTPAPVLSSAAATASVKPGMVKVGQSAVVVGLGFLADKQVKITVKNGSKTVTKTKTLVGGSAFATVRATKPGNLKVTVSGLTSGKSVTDKAKVKRR